MELTVLGAGPAYSDLPDSSGAAYLVAAGGTTLLMDLGQGSFSRLASRIEPSLLDGVLISHLHPDHFIDLVPLRHYLRYEFEPPRRVRVLGPRDLGARLDALHGQPGFSAATLDNQPIADAVRSPLVIGELEVVAAPVTHTDECYGFRIAPPGGEMPGLVYSGDCGRARDLRGLLRPGDALLAEISFGAGPVPPGALHLDGPAVGALAAETHAGRVLLTHLQMGFDETAAVDSVRAIYRGPVDLVRPGDAYRI
jgi:ribonuclease BN (tRNA processing enzyme)